MISLPSHVHLADWLINANSVPMGFSTRKVTPAVRELVHTRSGRTVFRDLRHQHICVLAAYFFQTSTSGLVWIVERLSGFRDFSEYVSEQHQEGRYKQMLVLQDRALRLPWSISVALTLQPDHLPDAHFLNVDHNVVVLRHALQSMVKRREPNKMDRSYRWLRVLSTFPHSYCHLYDLEPDPAWPEPGALPDDWARAFGLERQLGQMVVRKINAQAAR